MTSKQQFYKPFHTGQLQQKQKYFPYFSNLQTFTSSSHIYSYEPLCMSLFPYCFVIVASYSCDLSKTSFVSCKLSPL